MKNREYFKGLYFKCMNDKQTIAFILSAHFYDGKTNALLQIITDDAAFQIPFRQISFGNKPLFAKLEENIFSQDGIKINIHTKELNIQGILKFGELTAIDYDIMGPFKYVPFMQCRHSVYSMSHRVDGNILANGKQYEFKNGVGYIEGDRGSSFPKRYVWTQCNFDNNSVMLSAADIPLFGYSFTGIICIVILDGKEHRLATYLGAKLKLIGNDSITVSQGGYELTAKLIKKNAHPLSAPVNGKMSRTIHESASCTAYYRFSFNNIILCEFKTDRASFEFEYDNKKN